MARPRDSLLLIGIKAHVIAFDRKSGAELWRTRLPVKYKSAGTFVNVVVDQDGLFAGCAGELFALDPRTGEIRWHQPLKGLGTGLLTIASSLGGASQTLVLAEQERQRQEAAAAAV